MHTCIRERVHVSACRWARIHTRSACIHTHKGARIHTSGRTAQGQAGTQAGRTTNSHAVAFGCFPSVGRCRRTLSHVVAFRRRCLAWQRCRTTGTHARAFLPSPFAIFERFAFPSRRRTSERIPQTRKSAILSRFRVKFTNTILFCLLIL